MLSTGPRPLRAEISSSCLIAELLLNSGDSGKGAQLIFVFNLKKLRRIKSIRLQSVAWNKAAVAAQINAQIPDDFNHTLK